MHSRFPFRFLVFLVLVACDESKLGEVNALPTPAITNPGVPVVKEIDFSYDKGAKIWKHRFAAGPGYLLMGYEYNAIAPGLVADMLLACPEDTATVEVRGQYQVDGEFCSIHWEIEVWDEAGKTIGNKSFGRNWALAVFRGTQDDRRQETADGITKFQFGRLGGEDLSLIPTIYFSGGIDDLRNSISISQAMPGWEWRISELMPPPSP